jgi:hypothetical protein
MGRRRTTPVLPAVLRLCSFAFQQFMVSRPAQNFPGHTHFRGRAFLRQWSSAFRRALLPPPAPAAAGQGAGTAALTGSPSMRRICASISSP